MIKKTIQYRLLEIIPGSVSWIIIVMPFVLSFVAPVGLAYFVILFDLFWLFKAFVFGIHLISGWRHMRREARIDWVERCKHASSNLPDFIEHLKHQYSESHTWTKTKLLEEINQLQYLLNTEGRALNWHKIYHFVILPTYGETFDTLDASINSFLESDFPKERIVVVVATEEREGEGAKIKAKQLYEKYHHKFFDLLVTVHPDGIAGELKAKGANATWAAHEIEKYTKKHQLAPEFVIISAFDSDTRAHPKYFSSLTYKYIINPDREHRSFQPIPLFSNNIWETRSIMRINALSSTFWQMIESTRPYRLVNFSAQAMSLKTLQDINFWDTSIVSEDSRQYYRAFFAFEGDHLAIPLFTPVYMDAVLAENFWKTLRNQYMQKRRWAYGVEHFPYLVLESLKHPEIPFIKRFMIIFRHFEGTISWSTSSLLIALGAWLPIILNISFRNTVLAYNLPVVASRLLSLAWIGLIISAAISTQLLPPRPKKYGHFKSIKMFFQWILVPIHTIFFGSIPALDAQTRLLLGKYLGFWVTPKKFVKREK